MNRVLVLTSVITALLGHGVLAADFKPLREPETERPLASMKAMAAAPTVDEVGDVDSFGRKVKWAGVGQTIAVTADPACVPDEFNRCIATSSGGAFASFDQRDLETIVLPAKSVHSLVCHHITPFYFYQFMNSTGSQQTGAQLLLTPYVTVYNDVLNDPAAIDPNTGLPYGGQLEFSMAVTSWQQRTLEPGEQHLQRENYSRHCIAGLLSKQSLIANWGLPEALANKFFKNDTKIVFHLRGSHNFIETAQFFYGIRLTVD
ncbi:hypothetical protein [Permianibacter aggregans]|uniref:Uncharacterized protein n=1 Tax=Permianibacter aggregans TaxID=1510150 RepID=A0A4R6UK25_9GAMM|nr:hypothetical protein [Permianibacter aggregans]QGX39649.1 hypothetical protein E2H98_08280 [Permianibacter aggregans]TDQ45445.1 hypothetical protein EV696_12022 [Permianibacter aggregans]